MSYKHRINNGVDHDDGKSILIAGNLHKSYPSSCLAGKKVHDGNKIICFSEPNVRRGKVVGFSGTKIIVPGISADTPKVGISLSKNAEVLHRQQLDSDSMVTITYGLKAGHRKFITSIYLNKINDIQEECARLSNIAKEVHGPWLIAGDANCGSPRWGDRKRDKRGAVLENWCDDTGINPILVTDMQTFANKRGT